MNDSLHSKEAQDQTELLGSNAHLGFIPSFLQVPTSTGYGLGKSIAVSGLLFLPITVTQFISGFAAGPLARIIPTKLLLILGSIPVIVSFSLISAFHEQVWQIIVATSIGGIGSASASPPSRQWWSMPSPRSTPARPAG